MSRRQADNLDGCIVGVVILVLAAACLSQNPEVLVALVVLAAFGISLWVAHKGISRWERRQNMDRLTSGAARRRSAPLTGRGWETATHRSTASTGPLGVPGAPATELTHRLARVRDMSGAEFEAFVADVLRGLGYRVRVMGRTGDQGVDMIATAGDERLAVQCKNYVKPVGNRLIQEVFTGAKHHGCTAGWVVAPKGFTKGAVALAQSVAVSLYDAQSLRAWIRQIEGRKRRKKRR